MTRARIALAVVVAAIALGIGFGYSVLPAIDARAVLVLAVSVLGVWGLVRRERARQARAEYAQRTGDFTVMVEDQ